jgi:hypothetical protein
MTMATTTTTIEYTQQTLLYVQPKTPEIGLLCGFSFNARQLNIVQSNTRPLYASAASAGLSNQHTADVLR